MFEHMKLRTFIIASIGVFILVGMMLGFDLEDPVNEVVFSYVVLGLFPIAWISWQLKKQQKDMSNVIYTSGVKKLIPHVSVTFIVLFIFSFGTVWLSSSLTSILFPEYVEFTLQMEDLPEGRPVLYFLMIIYISFLGPIAEEIVFRGLLLKRLAIKVGMKTSIFLTSGLFGILHFDILGAFIFGFVMALLYLHTKNLLIPIAVHIANNFIITLMIIFNVPLPSFFNYSTVAEIQSATLPNIILLVVMTPLLIVFIRRYFENDFMR